MLININLKQLFVIVCLVVGFSHTAQADPYSNLTMSSNSVGVELKGEATVGLDGDAQYSLPLALPPGRNDHTPSLAIRYSSNATSSSVKTSVAGLGWSISGLSVISRCGSTQFVDGEIRAVNASVNDKLCLDGMRLIDVVGNYGQSGSEYRTLAETYQKIVLHNDIQSPNSWLQVFAEDGTVSLYKQAAKNSDGVPLFWYLSQQTDQAGNAIHYTYTTDSANNDSQLYLDKVTYSGFEVTFGYENRNIAGKKYRAGQSFSNPWRLLNINVVNQIEQKTLGQYQLHYDEKNTYRDLLQRVTLKRQSDHPTNVFTVEWQDKSNTNFTIKSDRLPHNSSFWMTDKQEKATRKLVYNLMGDVNGDGKQDVVSVSADGIFTRLATGNGIYSASVRSAYAPLYQYDNNSERFLANCSSRDRWRCEDHDYRRTLDPVTPLLGDVDGDGKDDLIIIYQFSTQIAFSKGNVFGAFQSVSIAPQVSYSDFYLVDVSGDGRKDLVRRYRGSKWHIAISKGRDFESMKEWATIPCGDVNFGDVNGDNLTDLACFSDSFYGSIPHNRSVDIWTSTSHSFQKYAQFRTGHGTYGSELRLVDINGDDLDDVFVIDRYKNRHSSFLSTGVGIVSSSSNYSRNNVNDLFDANNDGYIDALTNNRGLHKLLLSRGNGPRNEMSIGVPRYYPNTTEKKIDRNTQRFYQDVNGDSFVDIVAVNQHSISVSLNNFDTPRVSTIRSALGNIIKFEYTSLQDTSVYRTGNATAYPQRNVVTGTVVKALSMSNGVGGVNTTHYKYEGKRIHLLGVGNLGFDKRHEWRPEHQQMVTYDYHQIVTDQDLFHTALKSQSICWVLEQNDFDFNACHADSVNRLEHTENQWVTSYPQGVAPMSRSLSSRMPAIEPQQRFVQQLMQSVTRYYDGLNGGELLKTITVNKTYDTDFGYVKQKTVAVEDHINGQITTEVTDNTYKFPDVDKWLIRLLEKQTISVSQTEEDALAKLNHQQKVFGYRYSDNGLLIEQTRYSGTPQALTVHYSDFKYGKPQKITESWSKTHAAQIMRGNQQIFSRETKREYDDFGHLKVEMDPEGVTTHYVIEPVFGNLIREVDVKGNTIHYHYDEWGRPKGHTAPSGAWSTIEYEQTYREGAAYKVVYQSSDQPEKVIWNDSKHRIVMMRKQSLGSDPYTYTIQRYNATGQVAVKGVPSPSDTLNYHTQYKYDALGRLSYVQNPDYSEIYYEHDDFSHVFIDANQNRTTTHFDALKQKVAVVDALGGQVNYTYDGWGNLISTRDPAGNYINLDYNIAGYRTSMTDPDVGTVNYHVNALGLVFRTEKNGTITINDYFDSSERPVKRVSTKLGSPAQTQTWEYEPVWGHVKQVTTGGQSLTYTYYKHGLLHTKLTQFVFTNEQYRHSYSYDQGRVKDVDYGNNVVVANDYHPTSNLLYKRYLYKNGKSGTKELVWHVKQMDSFGNFTDLQFGNLLSSKNEYRSDTGYIDTSKLFQQDKQVKQNRYEFDSVGNLLVRTELDSGVLSTRHKVGEHQNSESVQTDFVHFDYEMELREDLNYDQLNRLESIQTSRQATIVGSRSERITTKLGQDLRMRCDASSRSYVSGPLPKQVNAFSIAEQPSIEAPNPLLDRTAVRLVEPASEGVLTQCSPKQEKSPFIDDQAISSIQIQYDSVGNILYKSDVGNYNYSPVTKPHAVENITGKDGTVYYFDYDEHGNMLRGYRNSKFSAKQSTLNYNVYNKPTLITKGDVTTTFKYGVDGKRYERIDSRAGSVISTTRYLESTEIITQSGNTVFRYYIGDSVIFEKVVNAPAQSSVKFLHKDHLGSVIAISNELGRIEKRYSYDAWGKRRNNNWQPQLDESVSLKGRLGFTGHEMLDELELIHMNGRVYDPNIARFVGADPYIQDAWFGTQAFNRYAYVQNNPLSRTDPTGLWVMQAIGAAITAYDVYQAYQEEGFYGATRVLVEDGVTNLLTGGLGRVAKVTKHVGKKVLAKVDDVAENLPENQAAMAVAGNVNDAGKGVTLVKATEAPKIKSQNAIDDGNVTPQVDVTKKTPSGGSPALKGDTYHPDTVAARQTQNRNLYDVFDPKAAANELGYGRRIAPQKAPFNSHGQPVFSNGKGYISPDVDGHNVTNGWKMFDKKGRRTGTWNSDLTKRIKD